MKKYLLLSILPLLTACSNDYEIMDDVYHFEYIEYSMESDDYLTHIDRKLEFTALENRTDSPRKAIIAPGRDDVEDYSMFHGIFDTPYKIYKKEPVMVNIPTDILETKEGILFETSNNKYNLFEKEVFPATILDQTHITVSTDVFPHCKLNVKCIERTYLLHITYTAYFTGEKTGNIISVKGTWEGKRYTGFKDTEMTVYPLVTDKSGQ